MNKPTTEDRLAELSAQPLTTDERIDALEDLVRDEESGIEDLVDILASQR